MTIHEFGDLNAENVLVQPVDEHDLAGLESEIAGIRRLTAHGFRLLAIKTDNWNHDMSPWKAPAVFGDEGFGDGADEALAFIQEQCGDRSRRYFIGGYSLAGLFCLWASFRTDIFAGTAAASPSVWFPGFTEYMQQHEMKSRSVYLSLGDREARTRNQVMATVADRIMQCESILKDQDVRCVLEWNQGNHFMEPDLRMAKAFAWVLNAEG